MCTVGSVHIKSKEGPAKVVLTDLVEMCKGVQHPTRGLFLRSYLAQVSRDKLPDTGSDYESADGGNVTDAVDFVVRNFTEMNKLWVRMQHQGAMKDKVLSLSPLPFPTRFETGVSRLLKVFTAVPPKSIPPSAAPPQLLCFLNVFCVF
jgi:hypothetical protein